MLPVLKFIGYDNYFVLKKQITNKYVDCFVKLCKYGYIDIVKQIYEATQIDIHINNDLIFQYVCIYNQLELAQWIYSLDGVISGRMNYLNTYQTNIFETCCKKGNFEIVKWVHSLLKTERET